MSNPWLNVMPGGVPFTPRPEDDDDDWGFGAPGDPVGEAGSPAGEAPVEVPLVDIPDVEVPEGHVPVEPSAVAVPASPVPSPVAEPVQVPVQVPVAVPVHAEGFTPHPVLVSTNVDTPVPATPVAPVAPVEETPGWAAWGDWDDEPATPSRPSALDALAPGRWGTSLPVEAEEAPAPAPVNETPSVAVPPAVAPTVPPVVAPVPEQTPAPAPVPAPGHPLPQPHPSVPPLDDPALPATPAPAVPPTQNPVADPATPPDLPAQVEPAPVPAPEPVQVPVAPAYPAVPVPPQPVPPVAVPSDAPSVGAPVEVDGGYVPEGYSVNESTGELTPVVTPMAEPVVESVVESVVEPVVEAPEMAEVPEGYWFNPFTFAIEPKPDAPENDTDPEHDLPAHPQPAPGVEAPAAVTDVPVEQPVHEPFPPAAHQVTPPVAQPVVQPVPVQAVEPVIAIEVPDADDEEGPTSLLAKVESVEELLEAEDDFSDVEEAEAAAEAAAKAEKQRQSRATRPVAVTERDVAVLQFLARYRMATYPQLAAAFGISYTALRHRMPRLAREGLVVRKAIGKSTYSVWMPTDAGMKVADMDLTLPTLSWATVGHTLGLVDVGIRFEALGEVVVTEREIRAADTRDLPTDRMQQAAEMTGFTGEQARLYIVEMGDGTKQYAHIPDMVLARPPAENGGARSVAVELELNHKPAAQWRKILAAYRNAPHISQVIYFTHQSKVRSGILAAAKEVGAEHMVKVRKFEPSEDSAIPLPGRG